MDKNSGLKSQLAADSARIAGPAATSPGSSPLGTGTSIYLTVKERIIIGRLKTITGDGFTSLGEYNLETSCVKHLTELGLIEQQSSKVYWWFRLTEKGKKFRFPKKWKK